MHTGLARSWFKTREESPTSKQDYDATGHSNLCLLHFVVSSAISAFHPHAGYTQPSYDDDYAHNHEGTCRLKGTWLREQRRQLVLVKIYIGTKFELCFE